MNPKLASLILLVALPLRAETADGVAEANYTRGLAACDAGEWEKALQHAKRAVTADAACARYHYGWAAANGLAAMKAGFFSRLGYAKVCLAAYRRAVELEPKTLRYRWALLNYYQQAPGIAGGDREQAFAQAAELGRIDAEQGRQALVQLYLAERNYDAAFRPYDEALRATPDDFLLLYQFGRLTLRADRRVDDGLAAFRRCLVLPRPVGEDVPTAANLHWRLGNAWERKRDVAKAREEYETALRLEPEFQPAKQALEKLKGGKETKT